MTVGFRFLPVYLYILNLKYVDICGYIKIAFEIKKQGKIYFFDSNKTEFDQMGSFELVIEIPCFARQFIFRKNSLKTAQ